MSNNIQNLDELLECAVREKGAMEHMSKIDRRERARRTSQPFIIRPAYYDECVQSQAEEVHAYHSLYPHLPRRRRMLRCLAYGAAACIAIVVCADIWLSVSVRKAGYAFDPTFGQKGGSEITALMQDGKIDEAMAKIEEAMLMPDKEFMSAPDPDYIRQLQYDKEELEFLKAVCQMRKGKYFKAKKALKTIVDAGGAFSSDAAKLLEDM